MHVFEFSKKISNWGLVKLLSLHKCNFEECIDVDTSYHAGKSGNSIDEIVNELTNGELMDVFIPFFVNVQDPRKKITLLIKKYVIYRCSQLERILLWVNGYFINHKKDNLKIYLLGDICRVGERFLAIQYSDLNVKPIFSSDLYIVFSMVPMVFRVLYRRIFAIIDRAITTKSSESNTNQTSFISNNVNTLSYKVIYFPHQSIFYGGLFVKDHFYSKDINSAFYPSNILHIELENHNHLSILQELFNPNGIIMNYILKMNCNN